jgi:hypothetical protein
MGDDIGIDWGSASVNGGKLTVAFTGNPPAEWTDQLGVQANADLAGEDDDGSSERSGPDAEMTETFRSFAAPAD